MSLRVAAVLVIGLMVAAILHGGIYTVVVAGSGGSGGSRESAGDPGTVGAYRINRFTASVVWCAGRSCFR